MLLNYCEVMGSENRTGDHNKVSDEEMTGDSELGEREAGPGSGRERRPSDTCLSSNRILRGWSVCKQNSHHLGRLQGKLCPSREATLDQQGQEVIHRRGGAEPGPEMFLEHLICSPRRHPHSPPAKVY